MNDEIPNDEETTINNEIPDNETLLTVPANVLRALLVFAANEDVRFYLNGIYAECGPAGARLVATDGHIMAVYKIEGEFAPASCILPRDLVEAGLRGTKKPDSVRLKIGAQCGVGQLAAPAIPGNYAPWRKVIPATTSGEFAHFDFELLARIDKAAKLLGVKHSPVLAYNDDGPAPVNMGYPNFFAVVMPMHIKPDNLPAIPDWIHKQV